MTAPARRGGTLHAIAVPALTLALSFLMRMLELAQPAMSPRGLTLMGLGLAGGLIGATAALIACLIATRLARWLFGARGGLAIGLVAGGCAFFISAGGGVALAWSALDRLIRGHLDDGGHDPDDADEPADAGLTLLDVVVSLASGGYVFLTSGWRYLLPWPLPLATLVCVIAIARTRAR